MSLEIWQVILYIVVACLHTYEHPYDSANGSGSGKVGIARNGLLLYQGVLVPVVVPVVTPAIVSTYHGNSQLCIDGEVIYILPERHHTGGLPGNGNVFHCHAAPCTSSRGAYLCEASLVCV